MAQLHTSLFYHYWGSPLDEVMAGLDADITVKFIIATSVVTEDNVSKIAPHESKWTS